MDSTFEWKDAYNTGIAIIDKQHKELFKHFDDLNIAIYNGKTHTELRRIIDFLESYVSKHFQTEEDLMLKALYQNNYNHISLHRKFSARFDILKKEFFNRGSDMYLAMDVEREIREWWRNHILLEDRQYIHSILTYLGGKSPETENADSRDFL